MLYISPQQFDTAMREVNVAVDTLNKRIDMLQERVLEMEQAKQPAKANSK